MEATINNKSSEHQPIQSRTDLIEYMQSEEKAEEGEVTAPDFERKSPDLSIYPNPRGAAAAAAKLPGAMRLGHRVADDSPSPDDSLDPCRESEDDAEVSQGEG